MDKVFAEKVIFALLLASLLMLAACSGIPRENPVAYRPAKPLAAKVPPETLSSAEIAECAKNPKARAVCRKAERNGIIAKYNQRWINRTHPN